MFIVGYICIHVLHTVRAYSINKIGPNKLKIKATAEVEFRTPPITEHKPLDEFRYYFNYFIASI